MAETIQTNGEILAFVITSDKPETGTSFFSPEHFPFQLGYMKREAGYTAAPHFHAHQIRQVTVYQEVLFVRSGKIKATVYDRDNNFVSARILSKGDCILFASGGHGIEILEDAEVIEVKQGPFMGDDKVFLEK